MQIVELGLEYPAGFVPGFFSFSCQVLLRNKIYNTQRQKIIQLYSRTAIKNHTAVENSKRRPPRSGRAGAATMSGTPLGLSLCALSFAENSPNLIYCTTTPNSCHAISTPKFWNRNDFKTFDTLELRFAKNISFRHPNKML